MPRIAYVILCSCLAVAAGLFARPAVARDDDGYYSEVTHRPHHADRVWYSSSCCYRKIVRHVNGEIQVRYVRVRPPYDHVSHVPHDHVFHARHDRVSHDDREWPREHARHYVPPRRAAKYDVYVVHHDRCHRRRVRVLGADGGAVWALTSRCY